MKNFVKYLGVLIVLIGVIIFVVYSFTLNPSNSYLIAGMVCVVVGIIIHVLLNKFIQD